jgi:hypothetical protein
MDRQKMDRSRGGKTNLRDFTDESLVIDLGLWKIQKKGRLVSVDSSRRRERRNDELTDNIDLWRASTLPGPIGMLRSRMLLGRID